MVEVCVVRTALRGSRWKGESMENSSCSSSPAGGAKGRRESWEYSESSIW